MKKALLLAVCLLLCSATLFAQVIGVVNVKPYFTFDNSPAALPSSAGKLDWDLSSSWWETRQDYWHKLYVNPSFLDLGMEVKTRNVNMVFILDIRQDALQILKDDGKIMSNIPFVGAMIDLNFPRVGYVDFTSNDGNFYSSIGRRQIKWGPSTYDMALSDSQPYLDNAVIRYTVPMTKGWSLWYDFTAIAYKLFMDYDNDLKPKSTFAHRVGFQNSNFRISIAELNMIYGKEPSLVDFTPFGLWHNNYQDDYSNVMLNVALEGKIGPVRAFGTFTMDDFDLPHEINQAYGLSNKPQAMGFTAGIEFNCLDGEDFKSRRFEYSDYVLRDETFQKKTGLNIGYEFFYCSTFMYNRKTVEGRFVVPFQFISLTGDGYCYDEDAFYLGFKYGPNTLVHRVYAQYDGNPLEAKVSAELIMRGAYHIDDTYGDNADYFARGLKTMKLTGPVTKALKISIGAAYALQKSFKVTGSFGITNDLTHSTSAVTASFGVAVAPCEVDWNNLF